MLTQEQENDLVKKLGAISKIYKQNAAAADEGSIQRKMYSDLAEATQFIVDKVNDINNQTFLAEDLREHYEVVDVLDLYSKLMAIGNTPAFIEKSGIDNRMFLALLNACHISFENNLNGHPEDWVAAVLFENIKGNYFDVRGCKFAEEQDSEKVQQALALKPLNIPFLTEKSWEIIEGKSKNVQVGGDLLDFQPNYNVALTHCKQIEFSLQYLYDENVRKFVEKQIKWINEKLPEFQKKLNSDHTTQELKTHLTHVLAKCTETQNAVQEVIDNPIKQVGELFTRGKVKESDAGMIAHYVFDILQKEKKLGGIENINIEAIKDKITEGAGVKKFVGAVFEKVQSRAKAEKDAGIVGTIILTVEDFLKAIWYACKLYILKNTEERKDIRETVGWTKYAAKSAQKKSPQEQQPL